MQRGICFFVPAVVFLACALSAWGATFGRVAPLFGGASDLVLDESRNRIYLTSSVQGVVQIYSLQQQILLSSIQTDQTPLSVALARDGKSLYVTCYDGSSLDVIDLNALTVVKRMILPAKPEGVAVGSDGRVLISTGGSGTGGTSNVLLLYDPSPNAAVILTSISVVPPTPTPPTLPPPSGRPFLSTTSQLRATRDGSTIVGVNVPAAGSPTVFVYETASNTVLRSRAVVGSSNVVSISDDGTRFLCGPNLFDTATLRVLAQLNLANAPYPVAPGTNFNLQSNQGGSAFSPDGQTLYAAFDISPVQNPPAPGNASQLMMNDPDNLLIRMGFQLPENLAGKMVISSDGSNAYALSDSGFMILPLGTISQSPLAVPSTDVVLLTSDPCSVAAQAGTATVTINNPGRGRVTATAQLLQYPGQAGQASPATAPSVRTTQAAAGPQLAFSFNSAVVNGVGTVAPPHDFLIQSPEAINIPDRIRVYENRHDADAPPGTLMPIPVGISANASLQDLVYDAARQRVYIANAGLNRVEVYDIAQQKFLAPIKVGQLPSSLALTPDGGTLYVANSGGESISIVDPNKLQLTGSVAFPAIPFNSNLALVTPSVIAASLSNLQVLMSNGTLWEVFGTTAVPRGVSTVIGKTAAGLPATIPMPSTMAATPQGDFILLATNTGFAYIYDPTVDDFVAGRQVFTTAQTGYVGPVTAGPNGQYFVMNGTRLNQALVAQTAAGPVGLVSAVATAGARNYVVFSPPTASTSATALPGAAATVRVMDATTGSTTLQVSALEGPLIQVAGTGRANINGRTMAVDSTGSTVYAITTSGLSIISLATSSASRPTPNRGGIVNLASYQLPVAANGWLSIYGQNLASTETASTVPLPVILGGSCVTLNNVGLPLIYASPTQINAQIPPNFVAGTYPLVIHSLANRVASVSQQLAVSKYAPAVFTGTDGQVALFHSDGTYVNDDNPANRDERLMMYAAGLGPTTGGRVTAGAPAPSDPLAVASGVQVFFGRTDFKQAEVIVDWSGLAPGLIGVYQLNLRVPGFHINGNDLVTVRVGGVNSPATGPVVPVVPVN